MMSLFQNLKVYIVPRAIDESKVDLVRRVLTENGARLSSYLTDSVSFLVADLAESSEVGEAREIYDIPVLTFHVAKQCFKTVLCDVGAILPLPFHLKRMRKCPVFTNLFVARRSAVALC
ncbi:unnamed protein product [Soboliphyme baturini]|uniref:BRCT domain-containing protein n=1 Tax=Soboliphyme baturini TaxID=241478 RepID=A0A183I8U3_9BILA|nr:unnamed protein product [Soboliphyme baturini]